MYAQVDSRALSPLHTRGLLRRRIGHTLSQKARRVVCVIPGCVAPPERTGHREDTYEAAGTEAEKAVNSSAHQAVKRALNEHPPVAKCLCSASGEAGGAQERGSSRSCSFLRSFGGVVRRCNTRLLSLRRRPGKEREKTRMDGAGDARGD